MSLTMITVSATEYASVCVCLWNISVQNYVHTQTHTHNRHLMAFFQGRAIANIDLSCWALCEKLPQWV